MLPWISPSKIWISVTDLTRAIVTRAVAERSDLLVSRSIKPWLPRALEKSLIYVPGKPLREEKDREVSSTKSGFCKRLK